VTHEQMMDQNDYDNLRKENAMLREQLALSMARQETLASNVNDGLREYRTLRAQLAEAQAEIEDWRTKFLKALGD